ncbi:hypothetical protein PG990_012212 [Apiospora arundinis]
MIDIIAVMGDDENEVKTPIVISNCMDSGLCKCKGERSRVIWDTVMVLTAEHGARNLIAGAQGAQGGLNTHDQLFWAKCKVTKPANVASWSALGCAETQRRQYGLYVGLMEKLGRIEPGLSVNM